MSHHRDNPNAVQRAFAKRQKELRGETIPDDRQPAICPHCQTRWTYRDGKWNAAIKRHGRHCQCPDNWKCTICKALILNPADFAEYEKNGTHVACMEMEREYARMESVIASASKGQQSMRPRGSNGEYSQFQQECYARYQSQIEAAQTRMRELKALAQEARWISKS